MATRLVLLHSIIETALEVSEISEVSIDEIIDSFAPLAHSEVEQNVGFVVTFVVFGSQLHFEAPLQSFELSEVIEFLSENHFSEFLEVAGDLLSGGRGTSWRNSCFSLSSLMSLMEAARSLTFVRYCARASIRRRTMAVMRSPSLSSISMNSE